MSAIVCIDYEDDGVYLYGCSLCGRVVAARTQCQYFNCCPYCGVVFTHSVVANSRAANDMRDTRRTMKYEVTRKTQSYWFKAWVPNTSKPGDRTHYDQDLSIEDFYFNERYHDDPEWIIKTGDSAYFMWGCGWEGVYGRTPQPCKLVSLPIPDNNHVQYPTLGREQLVQLIHQHHGCPMWFGIARKEE